MANGKSVVSARGDGEGDAIKTAEDGEVAHPEENVEAYLQTNPQQENVVGHDKNDKIEV
jgi:hypothetical protein